MQKRPPVLCHRLVAVLQFPAQTRQKQIKTAIILDRFGMDFPLQKHCFRSFPFKNAPQSSPHSYLISGIYPCSGVAPDTSHQKPFCQKEGTTPRLAGDSGCTLRELSLRGGGGLLLAQTKKKEAFWEVLKKTREAEAGTTENRCHQEREQQNHAASEVQAEPQSELQARAIASAQAHQLQQEEVLRLQAKLFPKLMWRPNVESLKPLPKQSSQKPFSYDRGPKREGLTRNSAMQNCIVRWKHAPSFPTFVLKPSSSNAHS